MRLAIVGVFALTAWPGIALAQQAIVLDRYMSPAAGTGDLLTIQRGLATVEDRVLPLKLGDEQGRLSLLAGIFYRTGKFVGLDVPHASQRQLHRERGVGRRSPSSRAKAATLRPPTTWCFWVACCRAPLMAPSCAGGWSR